MSKPATHALPFVGGYSPVRIDIKVVLPAPLGPKRPNISPFFILSEKFFVATFSALPPNPGYTFLKSLTIKGYL